MKYNVETKCYESGMEINEVITNTETGELFKKQAFMDLKKGAIRETLIGNGWMPPEAAKTVDLGYVSRLELAVFICCDHMEKINKAFPEMELQETIDDLRGVVRANENEH